MKTAMQRMLDDLLAKRDVYENAKMYKCVATLETSIEIAQFLLEKEKEQILNAFDMGKTTIKFVEEAEEYYNQTYNQEPKKEYQPSEEYLKKQKELMEDFIWNKMNKNNQNK
jgi:hypothetical protein